MAAGDVIDEQAMSPIGPKRTRCPAPFVSVYGGKAATAAVSRRGHQLSPQ
jgi:hypothetical protein